MAKEKFKGCRKKECPYFIHEDYGGFTNNYCPFDDWCELDKCYIGRLKGLMEEPPRL